MSFASLASWKQDLQYFLLLLIGHLQDSQLPSTDRFGLLLLEIAVEQEREQNLGLFVSFPQLRQVLDMSGTSIYTM